MSDPAGAVDCSTWNTPANERGLGRHPSNSHYSHGCRCEGCVEAHRIVARIHNGANRIAAAWVREHHPEVWQAMVDRAYCDAGIERHPVGRPKRSQP